MAISVSISLATKTSFKVLTTMSNLYPLWISLFLSHLGLFYRLFVEAFELMLGAVIFFIFWKLNLTRKCWGNKCNRSCLKESKNFVKMGAGESKELQINLVWSYVKGNNKLLKNLIKYWKHFSAKRMKISLFHKLECQHSISILKSLCPWKKHSCNFMKIAEFFN